MTRATPYERFPEISCSSTPQQEAEIQPTHLRCFPTAEARTVTTTHQLNDRVDKREPCGAPQYSKCLDPHLKRRVGSAKVQHRRTPTLPFTVDFACRLLNGQPRRHLHSRKNTRLLVDALTLWSSRDSCSSVVQDTSVATRCYRR